MTIQPSAPSNQNCSPSESSNLDPICCPDQSVSRCRGERGGLTPSPVESMSARLRINESVGDVREEVEMSREEEVRGVMASMVLLKSSGVGRWFAWVRW